MRCLTPISILLLKWVNNHQLLSHSYLVHSEFPLIEDSQTKVAEIKVLKVRLCGGSVEEVFVEAAWWSCLWRWHYIIGRSRIQGHHPPTSEICFSVVQSSNLRSHFEDSQLVYLLQVGMFNYMTFPYLKYLFPLWQWHVC